MKESPLVSVIILNYNAGKLLLNCVKSLIKFTYKNIEIIVVDNTSDDNSQIDCKKKFPQIKLIQNKKNLGYCGGNNVGIKEALGEFILILNPDTIVDSNLISVLVDAYKTNGDGLYQPKLLSLDDKHIINSAGNIIQLFGFGYSRGKGVRDDGRFDEFTTISYASGACLFTSKTIFEKIGYLDEFLWAYHDDLELGWRALKFGIKSYYVPSAIVYHKESYSFKWGRKKFYLLERNRHYCLLTHYSRRTFYKILPVLILVEVSTFFYYLGKGLILEKFRGYFDIIKKRKFINNRYLELEKKRKIPDSEIIKSFEDSIFVPKEVASPFLNDAFNRFISRLGKYARSKIKS